MDPFLELFRTKENKAHLASYQGQRLTGILFAARAGKRNYCAPASLQKKTPSKNHP
jgi:hypothetical protein